MKTWIALFRGINVGGKNLIPMARLKTDFADLGAQSIRTYIQSGNVVFESNARSPKALAKKLERVIEARDEFRPHIFILSRDELQDALDQNPFG